MKKRLRQLLQKKTDERLTAVLLELSQCPVMHACRRADLLMWGRGIAPSTCNSCLDAAVVRQSVDGSADAAVVRQSVDGSADAAVVRQSVDGSADAAVVRQSVDGLADVAVVRQSVDG